MLQSHALLLLLCHLDNVNDLVIIIIIIINIYIYGSTHDLNRSCPGDIVFLAVLQCGPGP